MIFFMVVGGEPERHTQRLIIDENLIVRIGQDDRSALEEFYTLTERVLYSYVLAIVKNPYDTQDVVQEFKSTGIRASVSETGEADGVAFYDRPKSRHGLIQAEFPLFIRRSI